MSGHLIGCAGTLTDQRLAPSHKLALLAFADSADDRTHIAFPGYEGVQTWAGVSRGRAAELIRDLVGFGYLLQHKKAHRGQRAEYVVFPGGCCDLHRTPAEEPAIDVEQLARAAGVSIEQARLVLAAMAVETDLEQGTPVVTDPRPKGSGTSDPMSGDVSGTSDPIDQDTREGQSEAVDNPGKGPERVQRSRSNANAFTPSKTTPLTPASGGASCARHKHPAPNCRGCGTTNRQIEARARQERAEAYRAAQAAAAAAERAKPRGTKPGTETAKAIARAGIAAARRKTPATAGATR